VARPLRDADNGPAVRARPVEAVPAEADADLVGLGPARRDVLVAAPDREQPQQHALVGDAVEVVQLTRGAQVLALRVEPVGAAPQRRLVDARPLRPLQQVLNLPVAPLARLAPAVADAVDPL